MDCKFAYMKPDIDYVLCAKEPTPSRHNRTEVFHAMCGHQVECPKQNCHKLSPRWQSCAKLTERAAATYDEVFPDMVQEPDEALKPTRKARRKAKTAE